MKEIYGKIFAMNLTTNKTYIRRVMTLERATFPVIPWICNSHLLWSDGSGGGDLIQHLTDSTSLSHSWEWMFAARGKFVKHFFPYSSRNMRRLSIIFVLRSSYNQSSRYYASIRDPFQRKSSKVIRNSWKNRRSRKKIYLIWKKNWKKLFIFHTFFFIHSIIISGVCGALLERFPTTSIALLFLHSSEVREKEQLNMRLMMHSTFKMSSAAALSAMQHNDFNCTRRIGWDTRASCTALKTRSWRRKTKGISHNRNK